MTSTNHVRAADSAEPTFRAGAAAVDISPAELPVRVSGGFEEATADKVLDPLYAHAIALHDGRTELALVVVDSVGLPRDLLDAAKELAARATGIAVDRILISATHTHTAPAAVGALGTRVDPHYPAQLVPQLARAIEQAHARLAPARIGWASASAAGLTHNRRWILRPDRVRSDPFGDATVRANMHPGHQNPDFVGPSGPVDSQLTLLAVQALDGRPLAVLANLSMHYYGASPVSADYYGRFSELLAKQIAPDASAAPVVAMSQGTSGDLMWMDYGAPAGKADIDGYSAAVARVALEAYARVEYRNWVPLGASEQRLTLGRRVPDARRLAWARPIAERVADRPPRGLEEVYAVEQVLLDQDRSAELKLQALRIGELAIAAIPNEVFALTGLKLKAQSPFALTMNVELANGWEGYIPTAEQHALGGYTTWAARTAGLEVAAEARIVENLLGQLERLAGQPRRPMIDSAGPYVLAVAADRPRAYWRLADAAGPQAAATGVESWAGPTAEYEPQIALYLEGPPGTGFCGEVGAVNRAAHFAGGRLKAALAGVGQTYSVEFWFFNGLPNDARLVTGYLFSHGPAGDAAAEAPGDHLAVGGTYNWQGRLVFFNGNRRNETVVGATPIEPHSWHHVLLVRDGEEVTLYLNGNPEPELSGRAGQMEFAGDEPWYFGGRNDDFCNFAGKLDEIAVYDRALSAADAVRHFQASAMPRRPNALPVPPPSVDPGPRTPEATQRSIHVADEFRVELVAAEPLVRDPVAIDWGPDGKLWVVEMADYPLGADGAMKPAGRVRYLEDTDGDGRYDRSTLFLDDVNFPNGVLTWGQGVLVTAAPEIFYAEDTDGDGRADVRRTLFSGFNPGNPQLRINGLQWGLDGWVYCANGWSGGVVKSEATGQTVDINGRDVRIRPDTGQIEAIAGMSEFGRSRNDWGDWFGCDNSNPSFHFVLEDAYLRRNPHGTYPAARRQVMTPTNPQVFAQSKLTKRFHSFEQAGRFTSGCATIVYRDEILLPRGEAEHAFVCEPVHNLVHHELLRDAGASYAASRGPDEQDRDFFAAADQWCRPVMVRTGPDGALWVVDMYRFMVEHPDYLPPEGRAELSRYYRLGEDLGRIWRVVPRERPLRTVPNLAGLDAGQLAAALDTPNGIVRDLAQRLLVARGDASVVPELARLAHTAEARVAVQALWTAGLLVADGAQASQRAAVVTAVRSALAHAHPGVRRAAIRVAETCLAPVDAALVDEIARLSLDPDAKVRLQLASSLGAWESPPVRRALAELSATAGDDPYLLAGVLSSINGHNVQAVLHDLVRRAAADRAASGDRAAAIEQLVLLAVLLDHAGAVQALVNPALAPPGRDNYSPWQIAITIGLAEAAARRNTTLAKLIDEIVGMPDEPRVAQALGKQLHYCRRLARDVHAPLERREQAVRLLARHAPTLDQDVAALVSLLAVDTPPELQSAAVSQLGRQSGPAVVEALLAGWATYATGVRGQVLSILVDRPEWTLALLDAVDAGRVGAAEIDAALRQRLLAHPHEAVRARAAELLAGVSNEADRTAVLRQWQGVLDLAGNAERGQAVFKSKCAGCHRLDGVGHEVGPNLAALTDRSPSGLLIAVLDPSRSVDPKYRGYVATLTDGRTLSGLLAEETSVSVRLLAQDGKQEVLAKSELEQLAPSGKSLMPEGLEKDLSPQDLADVLRYVAVQHQSQ